MNIITKLLDPKFVHGYFTAKLLPRYPGYKSITRIDIRPIKDNIWEKTYHVVIEFNTTLMDKKGRTLALPIYASAHSSEPRKNVYDGMKFLWQNGFYRGLLTMPRPLFYSSQFKAAFYRGIRGRTLYDYIRDREKNEIEAIVPKAACLFAKLHSLPTAKARNFNRKNSRIATVIPGISHVNFRVKQKYPQYHYVVKKILNYVSAAEERFLAGTKRLWLIHGDAHPENVIKISESKVGIIDFTDLCLSDFARDIGAFLQQVKYMIDRKISEPEYTAKIAALFLNSYQESAKLKITPDLKKRIDNYYQWTAMRTATYFLIKEHPKPDRALPIIKQAAANYGFKME